MTRKNRTKLRYITLKQVSLLIIVFALLQSCQNKSDLTTGEEISTNDMPESAENFDWLIGDWKRINESAGKETYENWEKNSRDLYTGKGYTLEAGDTVKMENMRLKRTSNRWMLSVGTLDEDKPTFFKMTDSAENSFTCVNDSIVFPKKIIYLTDGDKLYAQIEGDDLKIDFAFRKMESE